MLYDEILFRGEFIIKEKNETYRRQLISSSFCAWQMLSAQVEKIPKFDVYIKKMGLVEEIKLSKEDLEREAQNAKMKAKAIIERGLNGSR